MTTETFVGTAIVESVKRLNNTRDGNPRYRLILGWPGSEHKISGITEADTGFVYVVNWQWLEGKRVFFEYKTPRTLNYFTAIEVV